MKIYFPTNVDSITTSEHTHGPRKKAKKGEAQERLVADCNDETCIAAMERAGGARTLKAVPLTFDETEQLIADREEGQRLSAVMARELAHTATERVAAGA